MAITYTKFPVDWDNEGTTPPQDLIESGFSAGYKPPAEYFNAILHDTAEAIKELQSKTADFSTSADSSIGEAIEHTGNASLHIIDATCTYADNIYSLVLSSSVGNANYFCVRFKAPNSFVRGANFSLNGVTYAPVNAEFEANDVVILNFDKSQAKCFFVTGGGGGEELTIATQAEAVAATDNTKVMTPLRVKNQIDGRIILSQEDYANNANNKNMLSAQVLKSLVTNGFNYGQLLSTIDVDSAEQFNYLLNLPTLKRFYLNNIASNSDAIGGTDNTQIMTPLRVKEVVTNALSSYTPSIPDIATKSEAEAGTDNTKIMTPLMVKSQIDARLATANDVNFGLHGTNLVTASAYTGLKATLDDMKAGTSVTNYVTPSVFQSALYAMGIGVTYGNDIRCDGVVAGLGNSGGPHNTFVLGHYLNGATYATVTGKYNKTLTEPALNGTVGDLFVIGNGLPSSRTNAFRVTAAGDVMGTKAYTASGADYAEMFEWLDGNPDSADRRGLFVTLDGEKIRLATADDDYILGVVSATPSVVADAHTDDWCKKWQTDIFGERLLDENGAWVLNESFIEEDNEKYVSRADRKEWTAVGMVGKLIVVDDGTCEVNSYCYPTDGGIATKSDSGYRVIARIDDTHVKVVIK